MLLRSTDLERARRKGRALGRIAWHLDPKWTRLAARQATERLDHPDPQTLINENYQHYGQVLAELACIDGIIRDAKSIYRIEGSSNAEALANGGLLVTGHIGNWEAVAPAHTSHYGPMHALVKPVHNPFVDRWINDIRLRTGVHPVVTRNNASHILKLLKSGETVCALVDQNSLYHEGVFVPFFGKPACTHYGPAMLAARSRVPVVPAFAVREPGGFLIRYGSPIEPTGSRDLRATTWTITARIVEFLESIIRQYPEQWFWVHKRWRNQPRADVEAWKYGPDGPGWVRELAIRRPDDRQSV